MQASMAQKNQMKVLWSLLIAAWLLCATASARGISVDKAVAELKPRTKAVFALGSFWKSEAVFGCLQGVVRTTAGYSGGSKLNPDYHSIGDHAEAVEVTPRIPSIVPRLARHLPC